MFKLAIFDLDGTLLDTLADLADACNFALREGGFSVHSIEKYKEFIGNGPIYLVTQALPETNRDDRTVTATRAIFAKYYEQNSTRLTKPYNGAVDTLNVIKVAGVNIAVCTNKPHDYATALCEKYFDGIVDVIVGFKDGKSPKPDPSHCFEIMQSFDVTASDTIYIGDSGVDMQTAKNIGAYAVGVSWGFRTTQELEKDGADVIINEFDELRKIILD